MNCLDDRRLTDAHFGDGTSADIRHIADCATCAARAATLARDLSQVDTVLRTTAPPQRRVRTATSWRWVPLAAAAALALVVALQSGTNQPDLTTTDDDTLALADELVDTLTVNLATDDSEPTSTAATSTCTWGDPFLGVGCEEPAVMQIAWR